MLGKVVKVFLRSRVATYYAERLYADYKQAAGLLRHDLVWSSDFDAIRLELANLIQDNANTGVYPEALTSIVQTLISAENDLSI